MTTALRHNMFSNGFNTFCFFIESLILSLYHVSFAHHRHESPYIPFLRSISNPCFIWIVTRCSSILCDSHHSIATGQIEVNYHHLYWLKIQDYIIWFQVSMHVAKRVQFLYSICYLEEYLIELLWFSILHQLFSKAHAITLKVQCHMILCKAQPLQSNNICEIVLANLDIAYS